MGEEATDCLEDGVDYVGFTVVVVEVEGILGE